MNAQDAIDFLQRIQSQSQLATAMLAAPVKFVDNANTNLIDAMMLIESTFASGRVLVEGPVLAERVAAIHEMVLGAWEGREPIEQAREVVARLKSQAVIGNAMKGPTP